MSTATLPRLKRVAIDRPITSLCVLVIVPTLTMQTGLLLAGIDLFPGKLAELLLLTGAATLITSWIGGRGAVRQLFGGLRKWRIGAGRWALVLGAMPTLTVGVAAATGTLQSPEHGWTGEVLIYLVLFALIALTASLWEETTWSGFVQLRLMDRHGLLIGSMLTAIPFGLIHLPLAFEVDGWTGTTWSEALINWAFLLGALPFLRYVIGVLLVDTRGSVLAAAMLHASFNASGALSAVPDGWQYVPALMVLTVLVTAHRRLSGRSLVDAGVDPVSPRAHHRVPTPKRRLDSKGTHAMTNTTPKPTSYRGLDETTDRAEMPQYSLGQILGVWAAVTVPMGVLVWVITPWLGHRLGGRDPFIDALALCFAVGLLWMIALVLILVRREQGSLAWPRVRDALWLRAPKDPKTRRVGGRVWWWVLPFVVLSAAVNALPIDPVGPLPRDLPEAIGTDRMDHYFSGNWLGYGLVVAVAFLAPVAEELVFRGLLLPRSRRVFGRGDVVANGVLFTLYHVHQPWSMPETLIDGIVNQAYPTRRFQSTWMGLITHTAPSFVIAGALVFAVV